MLFTEVGSVPVQQSPAQSSPQVPPQPLHSSILNSQLVQRHHHNYRDLSPSTGSCCHPSRGQGPPAHTPGMMLSSVQLSLFTAPAPLLGFYHLPFLALKSLCKGIFNSPGRLQHRGMSVPWWMIPSPHQKPVAVVQNQLNWGVMVVGCEQCLSQPQSHSQHLGSIVPTSHHHSSPTRGSAQIPGGSSPPQTDGTGHAVSSRISPRAGRSCWHSGHKPDGVPLQRGDVKLCHTE